MSTWDDEVQRMIDGGAVPADGRDRPAVARFGDAKSEYQAIVSGSAIADRNDRTMLEVTGSDRATWLQNLISNDVRRLSPGEGTYAFVLNVQGRIQFDVNVLVRADSIRLDVDRRFLTRAREHFEKYTIIEDVQVADRSDELVRFGLVGPGVQPVLESLGASHALTMPWLAVAEATWNDNLLTFIRHDFCGVRATDVVVPASAATSFWKATTVGGTGGGVVPVGEDAVQIRRIEAGIPWPTFEITDEYLPAETGQFDRAVSFTKGCYLGQEIVERMRSRGVVARKLVGLKLSGEALPPAGSTVLGSDGSPVGQLTSACRSFALDANIALAYVKTASTEEATEVSVSWEGQSVQAEVTRLPFIPSSSD